MSQLVLLPPTKTITARGYLYFEDHFPQDDNADGTVLLYRVVRGEEVEERYRLQCHRDRDGSVESVTLMKDSTGDVREVVCAGPRMTCSCEWGVVQEAKLRKDRRHVVQPCSHIEVVADLLKSGRLSVPESEVVSDAVADVEEQDGYWASVYEPLEWE